jgi:penicillin-binding protein 2
MNTATRVDIVRYAFLGSFAILALGLFQTQVVRGRYYQQISESNRIRLIRLESARGRIFDRNQIPLATNRISYNVYVIPEDFNPEDLPILSQLLDLAPNEIRLRMTQKRHLAFTPSLIKEDIEKKVAMKLEERRPKFGGIFIQAQFIRSYPQKELGAHTVGYIGKISRSEYQNKDQSVYHFNSWIGRSGIENVRDGDLRGEDGGRQLEVDARGVPIRLLSEKNPIAGKDVYLTVDVELESRIEKILGDKKGAILVMDLKTGDLLSMVSKPQFDPNAFVMPNRNAERLEIIGSEERMLLDRSRKGLYPPGSVFKLVTAMAALENNLITPHTTFNCPGYFQFNSKSRRFKCWFHEGHGNVDLYTALERSCNVYFYQVGRLLGVKRLAAYARILGFGSQVPLELPTSGGLVPDEDWKQKHYNEKWYPGETISFAIGQSYLLTSPLQILKLVSAIATDGQVIEPRIVRHVGPLPIDLNDKNATWKRKNLNVKRETFKVLRQGMLQAVQSDKGTAQLARVEFGKLAAKTGTAQAPPGDAHAWFGGFYPFHQPEIAVVVFVERGTSGGVTAATLAKKVVNAWYESYGVAAA